MTRGAEFLKLIAEYISKTKKFDRNLKMLNYLSLENGQAKVKFTVTEDHINTEGHLHPGLTTTLIDVLSSHALLVHGDGFSGVSTNIHVSLSQRASVGDLILIEAKVSKLLEPLAFVEVELLRKNGMVEEVVARGQHTLFVRPGVHYSRS
ncbi:putative esterase C31F10.02 [Neodiprion lecontei]|uniref:Esterase C31F10.02 n=1 Tax=Neodiprion lecontei TaxID=441921 RepID=A0A6J0C7B3_NEOLC|nr:putative esterase C31F10.02 [Neodiprion lecontei]XP_046592344.1 putative esterase C31F10.02 [Neodiprion lecontei]